MSQSMRGSIAVEFLGEGNASYQRRTAQDWLPTSYASRRDPVGSLHLGEYPDSGEGIGQPVQRSNGEVVGYIRHSDLHKMRYQFGCLYCADKLWVAHGGMRSLSISVISSPNPRKKPSEEFFSPFRTFRCSSLICDLYPLFAMLPVGGSLFAICGRCAMAVDVNYWKLSGDLRSAKHIGKYAFDVSPNESQLAIASSVVQGVDSLTSDSVSRGEMCVYHLNDLSPAGRVTVPADFGLDTSVAFDAIGHRIQVTSNARCFEFELQGSIV